jgi:hypothetical protein
MPVEPRVAGDRRKQLREAKQALDARTGGRRRADRAAAANDCGDARAVCARITSPNGGWLPATTHARRLAFAGHGVEFKRLRGKLSRAWDLLHAVQRRQPALFAHWSRPQPEAG